MHLRSKDDNRRTHFVLKYQIYVPLARGTYLAIENVKSALHDESGLRWCRVWGEINVMVRAKRTHIINESDAMENVRREILILSSCRGALMNLNRSRFAARQIQLTALYRCRRFIFGLTFNCGLPMHRDSTNSGRYVHVMSGMGHYAHCTLTLTHTHTHMTHYNSHKT